MNKNELLKRISHAFGNTEMPNGSLVGKSNLDWEDKEVIRILEGKSWDSFGINVITSCDVDLTAIIYRLTPVYFAYYLPSFMNLCLTHFDEIDILSDSLFSVLSLNVVEASEYESAFAKLSSEQKNIVLSFFEYFQCQLEFSLDREARAAYTVWSKWG